MKKTYKNKKTLRKKSNRISKKRRISKRRLTKRRLTKQNSKRKSKNRRGGVKRSRQDKEAILNEISEKQKQLADFSNTEYGQDNDEQHELQIHS